MTVWNLHLLNARNALTGIMPELRATAREAVARVSDHAELPRFDLVIRAAGAALPEGGIASEARDGGVIEIVLNPDRFAAPVMLRRLVHDMHHLLRCAGPGYGRSLGEALVSEGLAGHFVLRVLGGAPDPREAAHPAPGLARLASNEWARLDYDHARWFLGKGDLRRWAGYGLGHRLVATHLDQAPEEDVAALAHRPAEAFRPALRRLLSAEGAGEAETEIGGNEAVAAPDEAGTDSGPEPVEPPATPEDLQPSPEDVQAGAAGPQV